MGKRVLQRVRPACFAVHPVAILVEDRQTPQGALAADAGAQPLGGWVDHALGVGNGRAVGAYAHSLERPSLMREIHDSVLQTCAKGMEMKIFKALAAALLLACCNAHAVYTIYIYESGGNVVASGAGTLDTTSLGALGALSVTPLVIPVSAILRVGTPGASIQAFGPLNGPASFGPGGLTNADGGSGDMVGLFGALALFVPQAYVSGDPLSSSASWSAATLATLGLTPGDYTWTWGSGPSSDLYTLRVGVAPPGVIVASIPTLSEWAAVVMSALLAIGGICALQRRRP